MMKVTFLILIIAIFTVKADLINKNVERAIDLTSQLVKMSITITLENIGKKPENSFLIAADPNTFNNLSFVSAKDAGKEFLKITQRKLAKQDDELLEVILSEPLAAGHNSIISVELIFTNMLIPHPMSITQKDKQLVRYFGNHYFYSPYPTTTQVTSVVVNSKVVENYTKLKPVTHSDSTIKYGPYENIAELSYDPMIIHFESNAPFLAVTRLERSIEISHWGNIAVEEYINILHVGAKLKGPFSRHDYQRDSSSTHPNIRSYKTILPAAAHSAYYRDGNGNISTSQIRERKDWIELELRPRYPLFGGWRSSYLLGYSVPSYQYLYKTEDNQYALSMRLIDNIFDDMFVSEMETKIILPVGVTNITLTTPYDVQRLPDSCIYKYLDTIGRPVIQLRKINLVEHHIQDFEIIYDWQPIMLLHEPIVLSAVLYALFLVVIIYVRLDFSIVKVEHAKTS